MADKSAIVEVIRINSFEQYNRFSRQLETKDVITMHVVDTSGELNDSVDLVTFSNSKFSEEVEVNGRYRITFNVKKKDEYKGKPQLIINYVKCKEVIREPVETEEVYEELDLSAEFGE